MKLGNRNKIRYIFEKYAETLYLQKFEEKFEGDQIDIVPKEQMFLLNSTLPPPTFAELHFQRTRAEFTDDVFKDFYK